jgi:hypothetical protein
LERFQSIGGRQYVIAGVLEDRRHKAADVLVVLHDKDALVTERSGLRHYAAW